MQTSYSQTMKQGRSGLIFDTGYNDFISKLADLEIPFGRFTVGGSTADLVKLPESAAEIANALDAAKGVAVSTQALEQVKGAAYSSYKAQDAVSVMRKGRIYVEMEGAWSETDKVFVRHTANGSLDQLGIFLASADGSAQVQTVTVGTPVAGIQYGFSINGTPVLVTADETPTGEEVKDALVAAINSNAMLTSSVSASSANASQLSLTALEAGVPFSVEGIGGILGLTTDQANVANAAQLVGAKFTNSGDADDGELAVIEFDLV